MLLPIILAGGFMLIAAVVLLLRQGAGAGDGGGGTPRIAVDQQTIDFGYVKFGETRSFAFEVSNVGDGTLRLEDEPYIEILEGCWPPTLTIGSMVLQPGQSTTVASSPFMMHEGMDGYHNFGVHLLTNDPQQPDFMVNVLSDWGP